MADISKLEEQAQLLANNLSGWENSTLQRIGKRIGRYGKMSLADVKSINNIAVVKQDMEAITKELARVTGYNISQIEQMYGELLEEQHLANQPLYDYRGKTFVPFAENRELQAIARAYAKTTGETMINLAKTKALCILDHNGNVKGLQKYYTDVLDKAVMQVTTGATDFHTAMRDSIVELGGSGVRVDYGGGVTRRLDTVVRQNLLWGAKQASTEYNTIIGEELGADGVEIDAHSNPRESHRFMQGKQYVLGKARTINGVYFESADEALERLQDYGCLHYKTPIICGISEPRYSPEELKRLNEQNAKKYTVDGKEYSGYDITQMQRRLESSVRNEKATRDLAKASGDNVLVKRCNERIKAYQTKYNEISEITGIQGDKKRMSVPKGTATVKGGTPKVEAPKKVFPKAKTVEEAEEYAKTHIFSGNMLSKTSYKGIDVDIANGINETLSNLQEKYGVKLAGAEVVNPKTAKGLKALGGSADAPFATQSITGRVYINKEILKNTQALASYTKKGDEAFNLVIANKDKLSPKMKTLAETYERAGKSLVDDSLEGMITHEYGHFLNVQINPSAEVVEQLKRGMESHTISGYSQHSVSEYLAECFVEFERGNVSKLDDVVIKLFKGAIK